MKKAHFPLAALALGAILSANTCSDAGKAGAAAQPMGKWVITSLAGKAVHMPDGKEMPFINIDSLGTNVNGYAGCNRVFGAMRIWGDSIAFPGLASTRMYCQETQATEDAFLDALNHAHTFAVHGDKLVLSAGKELAVFQRAKQ